MGHFRKGCDETNKRKTMYNFLDRYVEQEEYDLIKSLKI